MKKDTYFVDIDGTLLEYVPFDEMSYEKTKVLPGVIEWITEKRSEGHKIILTTARSSDKRLFTTNQLRKAGIEYDGLIMNMNRGIRYLVNDIHPDNPNKNRAIGINVKRDEGFENV